MKSISSYVVYKSKIRVYTPYSERIGDSCRKMGGNFVEGAWELSLQRLFEVQAQIGVYQTDLVEVEVANDKYTEYGGQVLCGWHVLAGRRGRDDRAKIYAELVHGTIPLTGGSVKNPRVNESDDARFRFWVPRDFAVSHNLLIVTNLAEDKNQTLEEYVSRHGEQYRHLIQCSLKWLNENEPTWGVIIDREKFMADLISHVKKPQ